MTDENKTRSLDQWSSVQVYTLAVICLLIGIAGGWFIRGSQGPAAQAAVIPADNPGPGAAPAPTMPSPEQLKQMADTQAKPLLDRLPSEPGNAELLTNIGNTYYDAQQYPVAVTYYERELKLQPKDTSVRTDLATAYWYMGNADKAIEEFNKSLAYEPTKPNTLFNLGIVKWQGKMDVPGAVAAWQKLLDTNPHYEGKDKVLQVMAEAQKHAGMKMPSEAKSQAQ